MKQSTVITKCSGVTLIIALSFLFLLTLFAVSSLKTSSSQQQMSGNMRDKELSFQATESALRIGESWIDSLTIIPVVTAGCGQPCVFPYNPDTFIEDQTAAWWSANSVQLAGGTLASLNSQPRYIIEYVSFLPDDLTIGLGMPQGKYYYYVTARGTGGSDNSLSLIQSSFSRRF